MAWAIKEGAMYVAKLDGSDAKKLLGLNGDYNELMPGYGVDFNVGGFEGVSLLAFSDEDLPFGLGADYSDTDAIELINALIASVRQVSRNGYHRHN